MSRAHVFDTLAETNLTLVQVLTKGIFAVAFFVLIMGGMQLYTNISLRDGQRETRELIIAISRRGCEGPVTTMEGSKR